MVQISIINIQVTIVTIIIFLAEIRKHKTDYYIRVEVITRLVKNDISNIVRFVTEFEDEFVKTVVGGNYKCIQANKQKTSIT